MYLRLKEGSKKEIETEVQLAKNLLQNHCENYEYHQTFANDKDML